jgi:hypothetical protein
MKPCPVNSSDLALARGLAHRLTTGSGDGQLGDLNAGYQRFVPATPAPVVERRSSTPVNADTAMISTVPLELTSWEVFLAWGIEVCRARAAFVVDSQGFVIASRGNAPSGEFTGLGAELCYAMEQLATMDQASGALRALELHFEGYKLIGLRLNVEDGRGGYVLGFIGSRSLSDEMRGLMFRQLAYSLPSFR